MHYVSPFPARQLKLPRTFASCILGGITGLFDIRWLLGMPPAFVERQSPKDATVTILIPAHNEEGHLLRAVESLFKQTHRLYSIIIIENGSTDRTGDEAELLAAKFPGVVFALRAGNVGSKAGALNAGLDCSTGTSFPVGELFVVMDADTEFAPDAIEKMLPYFYDPAVAVVCGHVMPKPPQSGRPSLWWRSKLVEYIVGQGLTKEAQNSLGAILVTAGCFSMYYTAVTGRFSDRTMAEDMEQTWELQLQGWKAIYASQSRCYAAEPETFSVFWGQRRRWLCGFLQCYKLHARKLFRRNFRLCCVVHYMFASALMGIVLFPISIYLFTKNPVLAVVLPSVVDLGVMTFALSCYAYNLGGIRLVLKSLRSIPAAMFGTFVVWGAFLSSLLTEWILARRLTTWVSGHSQIRTPHTEPKEKDMCNVEDNRTDAKDVSTRGDGAYGARVDSLLGRVSSI